MPPESPHQISNAQAVRPLLDIAVDRKSLGPRGATRATGTGQLRREPREPGAVAG